MRNKTTTMFSKKKGDNVTIDDFNILKVLGRGAFGKVMLVEKKGILRFFNIYKDSKELFALKSLRKKNIIENEQIENTKTEKMILEHGNKFIFKLYSQSPIFS